MEIGAFAIAQFSLRAIGPIYQFPVSAAQAQLYPLSGGDSGGSADFHGKVSALGILGYGSELGGVTGIVRTVGVLDCQQYR